MHFSLKIKFLFKLEAVYSQLGTILFYSQYHWPMNFYFFSWKKNFIRKPKGEIRRPGPQPYKSNTELHFRQSVIPRWAWAWSGCCISLVLQKKALLHYYCWFQQEMPWDIIKLKGPPNQPPIKAIKDAHFKSIWLLLGGRK